MKTIAVPSTMIAEIGYDPDRLVLRLIFRSGGIWDYADFGPLAYAKLMAADSYGAHFAHHIRHRFAVIKDRFADMPVKVIPPEPTHSESASELPPESDPLAALDTAIRRWQAQ